MANIVSINLYSLVWVCALAGLAHGAEPSVFFGRWGSVAQCAQVPVLPGGSKLAGAFEVSPGWLRHGETWCKLDWIVVSERDNGVFASARALCGEDAARGYALGVFLSGDDLTLIWDDALINGPMRRCP